MIALCAALAACNASSPCGPTEGTVERVIDGDTAVLTSGDKIRYLLIDAPETTDGHHDCYGSNATQLDEDLVAGKRVSFAYDVDCTDVYGRWLAYVTVDGTDVNALMIERGAACVLHIPPNGDARVHDFEALQQQAMAARRGIWGACSPLPPACR